MPFKPYRKRPPFTKLFIFLLIGVIPANNILASHHKGQIAYTSKRAGNHEIYVMDPDGVNRTRLTHHAAEDFHPSWSPNGEKIAFHRREPDGRDDIFVMNADGTGLLNITETLQIEEINPAWNPAPEEISARERLATTWGEVKR